MPDLSLARKVLQTEAAAVLALVDRLDARFAEAVSLIVRCKGRVIVTGMGKSGIICRKIAATLASTGTPAFFLHPAEAVHGDLGVIQADDVVIAMSYSGETEELTRVLETLKRIGAPLIALTGSTASTLALAANVALDCSVSEEACPMNLVPTAITDGDLRRKMGDHASIMEMTARDVMTPNPIAIANTTLAVEALAMMEQRKITSIVVIDDNRRVEGVVHLHDLWRTGMV
jgi:arabinose-5-phosphate isomerase